MPFYNECQLLFDGTMATGRYAASLSAEVAPESDDSRSFATVPEEHENTPPCLSSSSQSEKNEAGSATKRQRLQFSMLPPQTPSPASDLPRSRKATPRSDGY